MRVGVRVHVSLRWADKKSVRCMYCGLCEMGEEERGRECNHATSKNVNIN